MAKAKQPTQDPPAVAAAPASPPTPPPEEKPIRRTRLNVELRNPAEHPYQLQLWNAKQKYIIIRAGRRGGKTVAASIMAVKWFLQGKRVLYAAPTIVQVTKFWKECNRMLQNPIRHGYYYTNKTEHIIEKQGTEARIRAMTAWNADTLRGDNADLLILDEWQLMDETAYTEVGAPMLIDTNGTVIFIYTPPSLGSRSASKARDPHHAPKMFKEHKDDPAWLCMHFPTSANPYVSREGIEGAARSMTPLAFRQEILAEDTEEIPGALWTRAIIEATRVKGVPCEMRRVVVAIDPSGGNTTEVGIVAACEGVDGHIYLLRDSTMLASRPKEWAQRAINLYYELKADRIVGERNYGGDMVEETLRNIDESVSYTSVTASRGKLVRAEPILALYQQHKMHHVCLCGKNPCMEFAELEEEMVSYTAAPGERSPNRMDAMVWCGVELSGMGALGLLDLVRSGRLSSILKRTPQESDAHIRAARTPAPQPPPVTETGLVAAAQVATTLHGVVTADQTPKCPQCQGIVLTNLSMGEVRCQACGHQYFPHGSPVLVMPNRANLPLGGRFIKV